MFSRSEVYGGSLFSLAASVVTDLIHHDPLVFRDLDAAGLPQAFIDAVKVGVQHTGRTGNTGMWCDGLVGCPLAFSRAFP